MYCAGLAFLAFGFNLVDCGALLGHRLGSNAVIQKTPRHKTGPAHLPHPQPHSRPQASRTVAATRTFTL